MNITAIADKNWRVFSSLKFAIFILLSLAAFMVVGTFIPQNIPPHVLRQTYSPLAFALLNFFQVYDLFHAWWFSLLLLLLSLNLFACTINGLSKLPGHFKIRPKGESPHQGMFNLTLTSEMDQKSAFNLIHRFFSTRGGRILSVHDFSMLYWQKNKYARLGVHIVHISLLIILAGSLSTSLLGFNGSVFIPQGEEVDHFYISGNDGIPIRRQLDFTIACDKFELKLFPNGQPKDYISHLRIKRKGILLALKSIEVNSPLSFEGISLYQSSYRKQPFQSEIKLEITDTQTNTSKEYTTTFQQPLILGEGSDAPVTFTALDYYQNFRKFGPALYMERKPAGKMGNFIVLKEMPEFDKKHRNDTYWIKLKQVKESYATGLQVAKAPGVSLVWLGCSLMILGLLITFFMVHQQIWVEVKEKKETGNGTAPVVQIVLKMNVNRHRREFEPRYQHLEAEFKSCLTNCT